MARQDGGQGFDVSNKGSREVFLTKWEIAPAAQGRNYANKNTKYMSITSDMVSSEEKTGKDWR